MAEKDLYSWWNNLPLSRKFVYRNELEDYLKNVIKGYIEKADYSTVYYRIGKNKEFRDAIGGFPVVFRIDLYMDGHNYENFKDCLDEILLELAQNYEYWFFEIHADLKSVIPIESDILKEIFSAENNRVDNVH